MAAYISIKLARSRATRRVDGFDDCIIPAEPTTKNHCIEYLVKENKFSATCKDSENSLHLQAHIVYTLTDCRSHGETIIYYMLIDIPSPQLRSQPISDLQVVVKGNNTIEISMKSHETAFRSRLTDKKTKESWYYKK